MGVAVGVGVGVAVVGFSRKSQPATASTRARNMTKIMILTLAISLPFSFRSYGRRTNALIYSNNPRQGTKPYLDTWGSCASASFTFSSGYS